MEALSGQDGKTYAQNVQGFPIYLKHMMYMKFFISPQNVFKLSPFTSVTKIQILCKFGEIPSMDSNHSVSFLLESFFPHGV